MEAMNPDPETGEVSLFDPEFAAQPQPVFKRMRAQCPVTRAALTGGPVVSKYEDVVWALRHPEIFSSAMDMHVILGTVRPMIPQQIDPPLQTRFRKILDPQFSRKRMAEIEPDIRRHANQLIDKVIDHGECEFDEAFAIPLPCTAFLHLMGLPEAELDLFLELKDGVIRPPVDPHDMIAAGEYRLKIGQRIYAYFEKLIDERRTAPRDDIMTYLVNVDFDGRLLTREEILDISYLLLLGGLDTVTATIGCSIAHLAANPDKRQRLVKDPALIPGAVEELLRWESPVMTVPRLVLQDVTLSGYEIKAGELAMLLIGSADTDEAEFADAENVDFERERNRHIAFGAGPHRCLGSHLARMEVRVALEEWHRRIPDYAIKPGETPRYSPGIREVRYLPLVWERSAGNGSSR
jgi:cytochrome P450